MFSIHRVLLSELFQGEFGQAKIRLIEQHRQQMLQERQRLVNIFLYVMLLVRLRLDLASNMAIHCCRETVTVIYS